MTDFDVIKITDMLDRYATKDGPLDDVERDSLKLVANLIRMDAENRRAIGKAIRDVLESHESEWQAAIAPGPEPAPEVPRFATFRPFFDRLLGRKGQ